MLWGLKGRDVAGERLNFQLLNSVFWNLHALMALAILTAQKLNPFILPHLHLKAELMAFELGRKNLCLPYAHHQLILTSFRHLQ